MKNVTRILMAAALAAVVFEFRTDSAAPGQSGRSCDSQSGYALKPISVHSVHHQQAGMPRFRLWESTSGNWSGYAVPSEAGGGSDTFSNVEGTWAIPTVTGGRGTTYSSAWVGLDGYDNGTVEQIGTEQDWTGRAQSNYVWFEMYPSGAYEIEGFPCNPGDVISAQVHYVGPTTVQEGRGRNAVSVQESVFQLSIENVTRNVSYTVPASYTTVATSARASAEWILEAPSSRQVLPLADFGTAIFTDCTATSTRSGGQPVAISFWTPDPLTMIDGTSGVATPSSLTENGTAFDVTWSQ
jgi:hypothetical protein